MKNLFLFSLFTLLCVAPTFAQMQEDVDYNPSVQPQYVGGQEALLLFIQNNIKYPKDAKDSGIDGTIYVEFVIDTDGSVIRTKVIRGNGTSLDMEAVRVINAMPKWTPGQDGDGNKVKTAMTLPIRFQL